MVYKRKVYRLRWPEGHELHGLEVATRGLSVEKLFGLASLAGRLDGEISAGEKVKITGELFAGFASRLVSWNLEDDDGTPVPATLEGVTDQDMQFMIGLITTWMDAVASVDIPLPAASANGAISAEESTFGLASLSQSLPS